MVNTQKNKLKFRFLYTVIVLFVSVSLVYSYAPPKKKKPVAAKQIDKNAAVAQEPSAEPLDTSSLSEEVPTDNKTRYVPYERSENVEIKSRYFSVGYQITAPFSGAGGNIWVGKIGEEGFFTGFDFGGGTNDFGGALSWGYRYILGLGYK